MQKIEYLLHCADPSGEGMAPVTLGLPPGMPQEIRNVVNFEASRDRRTEIIVTEYDWTVGRMWEMSKHGMEQCLDKMAAASYID